MLVEKRRELKERIPAFLRVNYARYKKIGDSWRRQRGIHNKIRKSIKGAGNKVSIGYGTPKEMKNIHPSGYKEVLIRSLNDLERVNPKEEAIRISSTIGLKKRLEILKIAKEKGIHVLNPQVISRVRDKGFNTVKEMLESINVRKPSESKEEKKEDKDEKLTKSEKDTSQKEKSGEYKNKVEKKVVSKGASKNTKSKRKSK